MVRYVGMDVHREFAQLAVVEDGLVRDEGRIGVTPEALRLWAEGLRPDDQVALEATGNSDAIANLLAPLVGRVVVSNPSKTRAIAEAKVKTDKCVQTVCSRVEIGAVSCCVAGHLPRREPLRLEAIGGLWRWVNGREMDERSWTMRATPLLTSRGCGAVQKTDGPFKCRQLTQSCGSAVASG